MATTGQNPVIETWRRLRPLPGGRWLFSRLIGRRARYTGSIRARVVELESGYASVRMADRAKVRNHLRSIHAVALTNLGELATGLALISALPEDARGIPTHLEIEFLKKARGEIRGECRCEPLTTNERRHHEVEAVLSDADGEAVARITARWLVGPRD